MTSRNKTLVVFSFPLLLLIYIILQLTVFQDIEVTIFLIFLTWHVGIGIIQLTGWIKNKILDILIVIKTSVSFVTNSILLLIYLSMGTVAGGSASLYLSASIYAVIILSLIPLYFVERNSKTLLKLH